MAAKKRSTKRSTTKKAKPSKPAPKKAAPRAAAKKAKPSKPAPKKKAPAAAKKGKAVVKAAARKAKPSKPAPKPAAAKKPAKKEAFARAPTAKPPAPPKAEAAGVASRFVWWDLMTKDVAGSQSFYKSLLGWGTKDVDVAPPMNKYTMFNWSGEEFGGVVPQQDPNAPPMWLPYVWVQDVDKVTARARELGGKVLMDPMDIPNVGRFSVVADPTGGVVSPMSFLQPPKPQPKFGLVGPVAWCELLTADVARASGFYKELFGWNTAEIDMGGGNKYQMIKSGGRDAGGMAALMPPLEHSAWVTYFAVEDVDAKTESAKGSGARQMVPPMDIPNVGRFSWLVDPQGALFALFKGNPPQPSA